jgi:nanoRNase/pAp phosphatase (c-di-AMP/oligoRNAs hydrolase)
LAALERHSGERHLLVLQDYPDPDAISSALAHRQLSREFGIQADLLYAGEVSHPQNRALVNLLQIPLRHIRDGPRTDTYDGAVFIDNQGSTARYLVDLLVRENIPALLVVDHHRTASGLAAELELIEDVGATATVYGDLFRGGHMGLDPESAAGRRLATALFHGIITDTQGLSFAGEWDVATAQWLALFLDETALGQITNQSVPWETLEVLRRALTTRTRRPGYSFAGVGYLAAQDRDALPQTAEWLLSEEGVHTTVVFGIVRDWRSQETISGSLRTHRIDLAPERFLRAAFLDDLGDRVSIGGRALAGGFQIPLGPSSRESPTDTQTERWLYWEQDLSERLGQAAAETALGQAEAAELPLGGAVSYSALGPDSPVWRILSMASRRI